MWGGMCVWRRFGNVKIRGQGQCFATHLSFFVVHRTLLSPRSDNLSNQPLNQKQSAARLCFRAATFSPPRAAFLAVERAHARSRSRAPWPTRRRHRGACRQSSRSDSSSARLVGQPSALSSLRRKSVWALPLRKAHLAVAPHGTHAVRQRAARQQLWPVSRRVTP